MATIFVRYRSLSVDGTVRPTDCTTRWSRFVQCTILASRVVDGRYINLMRMDGNEDLIHLWISLNPLKVTELTLVEALVLGRLMCPEGETYTVDEHIADRNIRFVFTSNQFTLADGQTWTLAISDLDSGDVLDPPSS